jgi:hypothetical protein
MISDRAAYGIALKRDHSHHILFGQRYESPETCRYCETLADDRMAMMGWVL